MSTGFRLFHLRSLRIHPWRAVLMLLVVSTCVSMVVATTTAFASLGRSAHDFARAVAGQAPLSVVGVSDAGLPTSLVQRVAEVPGVDFAVPVMTVRVSVGDTEAVLIGVDASAADLSSALEKEVDRVDVATLPANGAVVGEALATELGLATNETMMVGTPRGSQAPVVVSALSRGAASAQLNGGRFIIVSLPFAQQALQRPESVDAVYVGVTGERSVAEVTAGLEQAVGAQALVTTPAHQGEQADRATRLTRDTALIVAALALLAGVFLIYTMCSATVVQRRRELLTLQVLGARRRRVARGFVAEIGLVALAGAVSGIVSGMVVGRMMIEMLPPVILSAVDVDVAYRPDPWVVGAAGLVGVVAAVTAAVFAVRVDMNVPLAQAIRGTEDDSVAVARRRPVPAVAAAALLLAGAGASWAAGSASLAFVLLTGGVIAALAAAPAPLARASSAVTSRLGGTGELAGRNATRHARRTWSVVMTIAVAIAVSVAIQGSMSNLLTAANRSVAPLGDTALFVQPVAAEGLPTDPVFDDRTVQELAEIDGVRQAVPGQLMPLSFDERSFMVQGAREGSNTPAFRNATGQAREGVTNGSAAIVSRKASLALDVVAGDSLTLPSPTGPHVVRVVDVVDYPTLNDGQIVISLANVQQWYARPGASFVEILTEEGAVATQVADRARDLATSRTSATVYVEPGQEVLGALRSSIEQASLLAQTSQWMIVLVAALGVFNVMMMTVLARRRELGVLRAIGGRGSAIRRMILTEAAGYTLIGLVLGAGLGVLLHYSANDLVGASMALTVRFAPVAQSLASALLACLVVIAGALIPAWRASRLDPATVLAEE
ncbi:MAG TPA: ABC transporter permease [Micromonosporaceae bacterium]|nr:ABC transporter permease [Micromonosporaceae bacterium]